MAQDTIQTIRDAETRAEQIWHDSSAICAAMVANAKEEAKQLTLEANAAAQAESQAVLDKARQEGDELLEAAEWQARQEAEELRKSAAERKDEIIRVILSELI